MCDKLIYHNYCKQMLNTIRPNGVFDFKLISRIDWQNLVFCSRDIYSEEKIAIKIFLNTFSARERYLRDIYFSELLSKEMKLFKSVEILYHEVFSSGKVEGVFVQQWIPGITWMSKMQMDFECFVKNDLGKLKKIFQELWELSIDIENDKEPNRVLFEIDTNHPSSLKYKLGLSEELAFRCLYNRLPLLSDKVSQLQFFYRNYRNKTADKCMVNGDPSAHELIIYDGFVKWIDWEYVLYGYPMMDIAYMFYSLAHNYYNDENKLKRLEERYFEVFDIYKNPMFIFYFIEKIVMVENATSCKNDIEILFWSINYAHELINETR